MPESRLDDLRVFAGGKAFTAGQTLDLPNDRAKRLVELGYVTKVTERKATKPKK